MFNLEQAIANWRQQMLAAGIQTPVPLEELEEHLREDIERQVQAGATAQQAFGIAVRELGQGHSLKKEFARAGTIADYLGRDRTTKINRILGTGWLVICMWSLFKMCPPFSKFLYASIRMGNFSSGSITALFFTALVLVGIFASISLFRGRQWGRSRLRVISILFLIFACAESINRQMISIPGYAITAFALVSFVLLTVPRFAKPTTAA